MTKHSTTTNHCSREADGSKIQERGPPLGGGYWVGGGH